MAPRDTCPSPPSLTRSVSAGVACWLDEALVERGVIVAFSERGGGVSAPPFAALNLAGHVGDDPRSVDENRTRLLHALGLSGLRDRLTTAKQVHGSHVAIVGDGGACAGAGAFVSSGAGGSVPPVPGADALITAEEATPLLLCFADCVPVVLVAEGHGWMGRSGRPRFSVAIVHAGWRGALAGIVGRAARMLIDSMCTGDVWLRAYVGAHIGPCHYEVDHAIVSQFVNTFGTVARAESGGLDLGAVVSASLTDAGVDPCSITSLGTCTAEATDRFFSHRAESGRTGRHAALACIVSA